MIEKKRKKTTARLSTPSRLRFASSKTEVSDTSWNVEDKATSYHDIIPGTKYRALRKLGEGGMGIVYFAEHIDIKKKVAIKILHREHSSNPEFVARFQREAQAATKIRHPNIVDVTDFGETKDGLKFFVMEYLEGRSLADILAEKTFLPLPKAIKIITQVCKALHAAHSKGIIHRDLKPENIFLQKQEDGEEIVKLLDFGIAKITDIEPEAKRLTRVGQIFGTPEYMSPEQAVGETIDYRTDIYALGIIMYEMFSGRLPFEAPSAVEILTKHIGEPPPPLRKQGSSERIHPAIEQIVLKCLAKDPKDRYSSTLEIIEDLWGIEIEIKKTPTPPDPLTKEIEEVWSQALSSITDKKDRKIINPPSRVNLKWLGIITGVLCLLGALLILKVSFTSHHTPKGTFTLPKKKPLPANLNEADKKIKTSTPLKIKSLPLKQPDIKEKVSFKTSPSSFKRKELSKKENPRQNQRDISKKSLRKARFYLKSGNITRAEKEFLNVLTIDPQNAEAIAGIGEVAFQKENYPKAVRFAKRALKFNPRSVRYLLNLGLAYYRLSRYQNAIIQWEKVLQIQPQNLAAKRYIQVAKKKLAEK
jgi:serine/threonine protein kinase